MKKLLMIILALGLCSCESLTAPKKVAQPKYPAMSAKTVSVKKGFQIEQGFKPPIGTFNGSTWDLGGGTLALVGKSCNNAEQGEKIVVWLDKLTIKNGKMVKFQDGLNIRADRVTVTNMVFESCEDAINSGAGCSNFTIKNSYFKPHDHKETSEVFRGDKALQMASTKGNNLIENNIFWNYMNGVRIGLRKNEGSEYEGTTTIRNNEFRYVSTAVQETRGKTKLSNNKFVSVGEEFKKSED